MKVGLPGSLLATRFVSLVGESPIQYLLRRRLALVARTLRSDEHSISRVAERCGNDTEAAVSRAFKREFGLPLQLAQSARARGGAGHTGHITCVTTQPPT